MSQVIIKNPYNLETIEEIPLMSEKEVLSAIAKAEAIAEDRKKWLSKPERIEILKKFQELVEQNKEKLIEQALSEGGKPYKDSLIEVERGLSGIEVVIEEIKHLAGKEIPMNISNSSRNRKAYTFYHPRGLVVAISAFNHPFNLIIHQVLPAIAAGCPVLVKPSSMTPLSCRSIVNLLHEAGLPKEYCQMVFCKRELTEKLVTNPSTRFLSFIGSGFVGWSLRSKLAPGASCALEHGGVAPVIIDKGFSIKKCIPLILKGGYYHAGQVCVSVQRVFVHESLRDEFVQEFTLAMKSLKTGDPALKDTDVGPLITPEEVKRVSSWVQEAVDHKAKLLFGGQTLSETLYEPTLLENVSSETNLGQKEVFGPVITLKSFSHLDHAIQEANSLPFAFQSSLFTENLESAFKATQELEALTVLINDHSAFRVDWMPFGGFKQSGLGVGGIGHSIKDMSIEKTMIIQSENFEKA